jgi:CHAD domain-containing protein
MPQTDAEQVLALMRVQCEALAAHERGARRGRDPEELHQMRTAVRRLRATLRAVPAVVGPNATPLRRELRWLGTVLGAVRDVDVLRDYLRAKRATLDHAEAAAARRALARLQTARARARAAALAALASPRYARLRRRLDAAVGRRGRVDVSLTWVARRTFKKLRKAVHALPAQPSDAQLHAVRIRVKRARYAAELTRATVGRSARRFIRSAARLQDILGEHQDAAVAEAQLRALLTKTGPGRDRLLARQRRRRRVAWAAFRKGWPKLERRGRKAWQ